MDDLSKRVNKMDPYGQGNPYGNPYNQPHPRGMAPRPAPNADGWSSGENHFSQQQLYQYQQQQQVWPLTHFFLFPFCKNSLICLEGKSMTPLRGNTNSLPFLPATPSSPSRTLQGLFELTRRPSRALDLPRALLPELQR